MPLLSDALKDLLAGPRGVAKTSHLWLPLLVVSGADPGSDLKAAFPRILGLILAVACKVQFSIQINDLCDRGQDRAAGKRRWNEGLSPASCLAVALVFIAAGTAAAVFVGRSPVVIAAYVGSTILGLFYSWKPVRFKERGIWGPIVYAASATSIFAVVPWAWLGSSPIVLAVLGAAVFSDKWVQIHFHQVTDFEHDRRSGAGTFVARVGLDRARSSLRATAYLAALVMAGLLVLLPSLVKRAAAPSAPLFLFSAAVVSASGVYAGVSRRRPAASSAFVRELPWFYLGVSSLVFFILPPLGFLFLALEEPLMGVLAAASLLPPAVMSRQVLRRRER